MKYQLVSLGKTPITNEGSGSGADDSNVVIAGIVSSCVVIILLVSITILIARWRKKKANSTSGR